MRPLGKRPPLLRRGAADRGGAWRERRLLEGEAMKT